MGDFALYAEQDFVLTVIVDMGSSECRDCGKRVRDCRSSRGQLPF